MWSSHVDQATEEHEYKKENHRCTDCPCCLLFLLVVAAWVACIIYGGVNGDPRRITRGLEAGPNGETYICGVPGQPNTQGKNYEDFPYLYYCIMNPNSVFNLASLNSGFFNKTFRPVCVNDCDLLETMPVTWCLSGTYSGAYLPYTTTKFMGRYCLPDVVKSPYILDLASQIANQPALRGWAEQVQEGLQSIVNARWLLLGAFVFAIIMGYLYLFLLKCCAEPLIWITMIATIVAFLALGLTLILRADHFAEKVKDLDVPDDLQKNAALAARITGIISIVISFGLFCAMCCFMKSIRVAAAVIDVACETMWEMPILLVLPVLKCLLKGLLVFLIIFGGILIGSTSMPVIAGYDGMSRTFDYTWWQKCIIAFYVFASLWLVAYLAGYYEFVVAHIVGDYYYAPYVDGYNGQEKMHTNQCLSMFQALWHGAVTHSGSIAFGSFLVALVKYIQALLMYAQKQNESAGGNQVVACLISCLLVCFKCCEETIKFINKNAYIDIAISGVDNFCEAAKNAFAIICQQGGAMYILNGVTVIFSMFGTLFIAGATAGLTYLVLLTGALNKDEGDGSSQAVPMQIAVVIAAFIIAFIVGMAFFDVFDMVADSLMYCWGYDRYRNRPSTTAPQELRELCAEAHLYHD